MFVEVEVAELVLGDGGKKCRGEYAVRMVDAGLTRRLFMFDLIVLVGSRSGEELFEEIDRRL